MYCSICGTKIREGAEFCTRCGATVGKPANEARPNRRRHDYAFLQAVAFVLAVFGVGVLGFGLFFSFGFYQGGQQEIGIAATIASLVVGIGLLAQFQLIILLVDLENNTDYTSQLLEQLLKKG